MAFYFYRTDNIPANDIDRATVYTPATFPKAIIRQNADYTYSCIFPLYLNIVTRNPVNSKEDLYKYVNTKDTDIFVWDENTPSNMKNNIFFGKLSLYLGNFSLEEESIINANLNYYGITYTDPTFIYRLKNGNLVSKALPGERAKTSDTQKTLDLHSEIINLLNPTQDYDIITNTYDFGTRDDGTYLDSIFIDEAEGSNIGDQWIDVDGYTYAIKFPNDINNTSNFVGISFNFKIPNISSNMPLQNALSNAGIPSVIIGHAYAQTYYLHLHSKLYPKGYTKDTYFSRYITSYRPSIQFIMQY